MPEERSTISAVWEGMPVIDATGAHLGKVEYVRMGDPEAVTTRGQRPAPEGDGLFAAFARTISGAEPEVAQQRAEHLVRLGFFKVDGRGLLDRDFYAASDQIDYIGQDHVRLAVAAAELATEH